MSNSNLHNIQKLPIVVAGGGAGQLRGNQHIRYPDETPLTDLYLTLLGRMGMPTERVGDSTGELAHLTDLRCSVRGVVSSHSGSTTNISLPQE